MRVRTLGTTSVRQLVDELDVPAADAHKVAQRVAQENGVADVDRALPLGTMLTLDDAFFPASHAQSPSAQQQPAHVQRADAGKQLGVLGLFGLQQRVDGQRKQLERNGIGALANLASLPLPPLLDRGTLDVKVALRGGEASLPLGEGRSLALDVPPGTTLTLKVEVRGGPRGLEIAGADVAFSKPVRVKNPGELALGNGLLGSVASGVVGVAVDGITLGKDGSVVPRGTVTRPSLNPFKHALGNGKSDLMTLESAVKLAGAPKVNTALSTLLHGDVVDKRAPGAAAFAAGVPKSFAMDELVGSLGALVSEGTFNLTIEGRAGFVDVGSGSVAVRGRDSPLIARIGGSFDVDKAGAKSAIEIEAQGSVETAKGSALPVTVRLDDDAAGAAVGPLSVSTTKDGAVEVNVSGALLAAVRALSDRYRVDIGDEIRADIDGGISFGAKAKLSVDKQSGVVIESVDGARASVEMNSGRVRGDIFDVAIGANSSASFEATSVRFDDNGKLVVDNAAAGFAVEIESATLKRGALGARLTEPGLLEGKFALHEDSGAAGGVVGAGEARVTVRARPRVLGVPMPAKASVGGAVKVELMRNAIAFTSSESVRLGG